MRSQRLDAVVDAICRMHSPSTMLSSVLNSEQAIEVNIAIMRAFVRLRQMLETNEELNRKFTVVMRKLSTHDKYFQVVFGELKKLTENPPKSNRQIGFKRNT